MQWQGAACPTRSCEPDSARSSTTFRPGQLVRVDVEVVTTGPRHVVVVDGCGPKGTLRIMVTNTGAGYCLPTGVTAIREMWLEEMIIRLSQSGRAEEGRR